VRVSTRVLVFEDDVPSASSVTSFSLDRRSVAEPSDPEADQSQQVYAFGVLPASASHRLRELFTHLRQLFGIALDHYPASPEGTAEVVRCGDLALDLRTGRVARGEEFINVSRLEFGLLYALIRRRGVVATRKDLVEEVWGPRARISMRAVDTHIARLRRKIEKIPAHPSYILTAVALGYRFALAPEGDMS
jgi:DNA-binding response OmpR family regulator